MSIENEINALAYKIKNKETDADIKLKKEKEAYRYRSQNFLLGREIATKTIPTEEMSSILKELIPYMPFYQPKKEFLAPDGITYIRSPRSQETADIFTFDIVKGIEYRGASRDSIWSDKNYILFYKLIIFRDGMVAYEPNKLSDRIFWPHKDSKNYIEFGSDLRNEIIKKIAELKAGEYNLEKEKTCWKSPKNITQAQVLQMVPYVSEKLRNVLRNNEIRKDKIKAIKKSAFKISKNIEEFYSIDGLRWKGKSGCGYWMNSDGNWYELEHYVINKPDRLGDSVSFLAKKINYDTVVVEVCKDILKDMPRGDTKRIVNAYFTGVTSPDEYLFFENYTRGNDM